MTKDGRVIAAGFTNNNELTFKYSWNNLKLRVIFAGDDMYKGSSLDITVGPNKPQSSYGNGTNSANKYSNGNLNVNADMKDTGIPIYMILIVLISSIGCIFRIRK